MIAPDMSKVCYTIADCINVIVEKFPDNGIFVESGTYIGNTAAFIVQALLKAKKKPRFYTIDNFKFTTVVNRQKQIDSLIDKLAEEVEDGRRTYDYNIEYLGVKDYITTIEEDAIRAISKFQKVDCVFLDDNPNAQHIRQELNLWIPKIADGGLIIGDDYSDRSIGEVYNSIFGSNVLTKTKRGGCYIDIDKYREYERDFCQYCGSYHCYCEQIR